jgi:uncharacterized protein YqeY
MRERLSSELKAAIKAGDKSRAGTLRMIMAALKDKDIEARGQSKVLADEDIFALLQKMVKSRKESQDIYERAGRPELATQEGAEIAVIEGFLPKPLSEPEVEQAVAAAIAETAASSVKDMGKVVGALKARYAGRMDFAKVSALIKSRLAAARTE